MGDRPAVGGEPQFVGRAARVTAASVLAVPGAAPRVVEVGQDRGYVRDESIRSALGPSDLGYGAVIRSHRAVARVDVISRGENQPAVLIENRGIQDEAICRRQHQRARGALNGGVVGGERASDHGDQRGSAAQAALKDSRRDVMRNHAVAQGQEGIVVPIHADVRIGDGG